MNVAQIIRRPLIVETMYQQRWLESALAREFFLVVTFNLLLIATAQISIPLAAGVPITGQTFGVLLTAMALGRVRGVGVIALYLAEGAAGLPVFASGGAGPATFFGTNRRVPARISCFSVAGGGAGGPRMGPVVCKITRGSYSGNGTHLCLRPGLVEPSC